jgi:hypothetical protein
MILTVLCHGNENLNESSRTRTLGRLTSRWDYNIKVDVSGNGMGKGGLECLAQDRALENTIINIGVF